jgi:hypothetical protein
VGWMTVVQFLAGTEISLFSAASRMALEPTTFYQIGTSSSFPPPSVDINNASTIILWKRRLTISNLFPNVCYLKCYSDYTQKNWYGTGMLSKHCACGFHLISFLEKDIGKQH